MEKNWQDIFREGFHSNDYTLTEYLEKFYHPPKLLSESPPVEAAGVQELDLGKIAVDIRRRVMHYNDDIIKFQDWFKQYASTLPQQDSGYWQELIKFVRNLGYMNGTKPQYEFTEQEIFDSFKQQKGE